VLRHLVPVQTCCGTLLADDSSLAHGLMGRSIGDKLKMDETLVRFEHGVSPTRGAQDAGRTGMTLKLRAHTSASPERLLPRSDRLTMRKGRPPPSAKHHRRLQLHAGAGRNGCL